VKLIFDSNPDTRIRDIVFVRTRKFSQSVKEALVSNAVQTKDKRDSLDFGPFLNPHLDDKTYGEPDNLRRA